MLSFKHWLEAYGDSEYGPVMSMTRDPAHLRINGREFEMRGIRSKYTGKEGPDFPLDRIDYASLLYKKGRKKKLNLFSRGFAI